MRALMSELERMFDAVIVDAPPLLPVTDAAILSRLTSGAILITAMGRTRRHQLRGAFDALASAGGRTFGIVLTMVRRKGGPTDGYRTYGTYYGALDLVDESVAPGPTGRRVASAE